MTKKMGSRGGAEDAEGAPGEGMTPLTGRAGVAGWGCRGSGAGARCVPAGHVGEWT
jgi:hypothetical protein